MAVYGSLIASRRPARGGGGERASSSATTQGHRQGVAAFRALRVLRARLRLQRTVRRRAG